jgi:D-alanyl-lipoteichoic acid acyltransferase DltB (MBOAT superfamily)
MVFNSLHFLAFFPIVTLGYFLLNHRYRWLWLLAASCYFYMAFIPAYILILFFTIAVDYAVGLKLPSMSARRKRLLLCLSLCANIGVLAIFKYYGFIDANLEAASRFLGWNYSLPALAIVLPIGLSFHTFQSMSYIIEVYRGHQQPERHLGIFALYVMYYPQLVAGPIERPQNLLHQLRARHVFEYERVRSGLQQMLWGLFKKVAIADPLARTVDMVYGDPAAYSGLELVTATVLFAVQIYCDFSGYSDIAIGASRVMGIDLMQNFRQPYWSQSISEFWRRWHISLSTWFRDYLYIPLGGNRGSAARKSLNLFIVFLVSGLWHGASWAFVTWGALHGAYLVFSSWTESYRRQIAQGIGLDRLPAARAVLRTLVTFSLVCFAWIFFRAESMPQALYIIRHIGADLPGDLLSVVSPSGIGAFLSGLQVSKYTLLAILVMESGHFLQHRTDLFEWVNTRPAMLRWSLYYSLALVVLLRFDNEGKQFIYFQF